MNLINPANGTYELPGGSIINPNTDQEMAISQQLVKFIKSGQIHFGVNHIPTIGGKKDKEGNTIYTKANGAIGSIVAKNECRTHFGTYHFLIKLPNFRGSGPAIGLIDLLHKSEGGMGIPPEIDIMEHFRKDSFLTRFGITSTFHEGPTYEDNHFTAKKYGKFGPIDRKEIDIVFKGTPEEMVGIINDKQIMRKDKNTPNFPTKPMNLIMGAGLGLDGKPNIKKFDNFIIYTAEYEPLQIKN